MTSPSTFWLYKVDVYVYRRGLGSSRNVSAASRRCCSARASRWVTSPIVECEIAEKYNPHAVNRNLVSVSCDFIPNERIKGFEFIESGI